ncbi:outer membrane protein assembly factor BamD [Uliginosibacterium sp. sgz301328]|uniref:outer membrane protein assembly factor BamD n=1 Tax=Uliginosibacterium sp. sgz301328 TaxID=3243764 RepID=UPI00359E253C
MFKLTKWSVPVVFAICLAACGSNEPKDDPNATPQQMYAEAKDLMDSGSYEQAIKLYERLQARFPYGNYAQQAEMDVAYSYYKLRDVPSAVSAADRFIKAHPNHPNVDYAYYLKGLSYYNTDDSWMTYIVSMDLADRDPIATREAFDTFKELITRYPNSRYTPDATERMKKLVQALADNELHVARYYSARRAPLAAANRAQVVLRQFPESPAVEEALGIMVKSYEQLGLTSLRNDAERVLRQNFPNSKFLTASK